MEFNRSISIDGVFYDIPLVSVKRTFDVLDKFADRSEEGDLLREVLGVYANFQLSFGIIDNVDLYERLIDKLTEPEAFHEFSMPISSEKDFQFRGYVSKVSDEYLEMLETGVKFQGLTCSFTMKKPFRTP